MTDLSARELTLMIPIAAVVMWMGVYPESFLAPMRRDVGVVLARVDPVWGGGDSRLAGGTKPAQVASAEAR
jgi:NADH-quinone oxidoreductase subunit M